MISKRKLTTGIFAPKNRKFLIAGVAAAAIGTWLLAGDKIKAIFKGEPEPPSLPEPEPTPAPAQAIAPPRIVQQVTTTESIDLDKRLLKGVTGNEVERLQTQINDTFYKLGYKKGHVFDNKDTGKSWKFPLTVDGDFGEQTYNAVYNNYVFFKDKGYITLDQARYDWVYYYGYKGFDFPSSLRSSSRYKRYADRYKTGKIDAQK
jgi:hypothetical protein